MKNRSLYLLLLISFTAFAADNIDYKITCDYTKANDAQIESSRQFARLLVNARSHAKSRERAPIFIGAGTLCVVGVGLTAYCPWLMPINIATSWFYLKKTQQRNMRVDDTLLKITQTVHERTQQTPFPLIDLHSPLGGLLALQTSEDVCDCSACSLGCNIHNSAVASFDGITPTAYEFVYEDWNLITATSQRYQQKIQKFVHNAHDAQVAHSDNAPKCWKHLIID